MQQAQGNFGDIMSTALQASGSMVAPAPAPATPAPAGTNLPGTQHTDQPATPKYNNVMEAVADENSSVADVFKFLGAPAPAPAPTPAPASAAAPSAPTTPTEEAGADFWKDFKATYKDPEFLTNGSLEATIKQSLSQIDIAAAMQAEDGDVNAVLQGALQQSVDLAIRSTLVAAQDMMGEAVVAMFKDFHERNANHQMDVAVANVETSGEMKVMRDMLANKIRANQPGIQPGQLQSLLDGLMNKLGPIMNPAPQGVDAQTPASTNWSSF